MSNQTYLIVDDDKSFRDLHTSLIFRLSKSAVRVETAENGIEALKILSQPGCEIRIVMTDYHMPQMHGLELIRAIKTDYRFGHLAIILCTSIKKHEDTELARLLDEYPDVAYLQKGKGAAALKQILEQLNTT